MKKKHTTIAAVGDKVEASYDGTNFTGFILAIKQTPDSTWYLCAYLEDQDDSLMVQQLWIGPEHFALV